MISFDENGQLPIPQRQPWRDQLGDLPKKWMLTPCNGKKQPIDPQTNRLLDDWPNRCMTSEQLQHLLSANIKAVGVAMGPISGGLLAVDFDAKGSEEQFQLAFGRPATDLPNTVSWSSGKPGRRQLGFNVSQEYWPQLRGRKVWKNQDKNTCLELRWSGHQSVVLGAHPETNGYTWCPGRSPRDLQVAEAPGWLLQPLMHEERSVALAGVKTTVEEECKRARCLLKYISPRDDYEGWLQVGMALHSVDESLLDEWIDHSRGSNFFDENECIEKWSSFKGSGITLGTLYYFAKEESGDIVDLECQSASANKSEKPGSGTLRWGEGIERMLLAITAGDQDKEMELRAAIMNTYRRSDQQVDAALFKLHTKKTAGIKKVCKRTGLDLSKIKASDWLLPGFVIKNDLTLIYGNAGSGKTTVALGLADALLQGNGFLDHQIKTAPGRVLFIASDSGAQPLISALQDMNQIDRPEYKEGASKRFHVWASDPEQDMLAWDVSLANCIELQSFVTSKKIDLVIIDSCKAVFTGAGIEYADNNLVTAVLTYFKQVICVSTSVIFINHDGREKGATAGAKAWKEIPSIVHQIKRPDEKQGEGSKSFREWTCVKNRLGGERQFHYRLEDGALAVTQATEVVGNCIDQIVKCLNESAAGELCLNDLRQRLTPAFSLGTIKNTLTNAVNGSKPRLKRVLNKRGFYRLAC
jgi:hypothetical protein